MVDPIKALLIATALGLAAAVLLWPRRGLLWRIRQSVRAGDRVRIEDALKHLYDCEYREVPATLQSLSGALGLAGNRTAQLAARLMALGLVRAEGGTYRLTADGRSDALRVIRIHRLWERYLSDETGLHPLEWHTVADAREHTTTAEEADALAARLADPLFDPHGDPIPTADGAMPPARGLALPELPAGQPAEIVHIEDEPHEVYAQLLAEGLQLGMRVRLFESTPTRTRFEADGEEHILAPVVAANLAAVPIVEPADVQPAHRLSSLSLGQRARVVGLSPACRGIQRRRLLDLGLVPGTVVEAELRSASGDPTAYRVRGALLALRRTQAEQIHIDGGNGGDSGDDSGDVDDARGIVDGAPR